MKIYISGRISGLDIDEARVNFKRGESLAFNYFSRQTACCPCGVNTDRGVIQVVNPMEKVSESLGYTYWTKGTRADYMREDIKLLMDCAGIFMLNNWKKSKGARFEHKIAKWLNMAIGYEND